jgi:hypothetical protein
MVSRRNWRYEVDETTGERRAETPSAWAKTYPARPGTADAAVSRRQWPPEPLDALPVRLRGSSDPWHPRLDRLGSALLTE